MQTSCLMRLSPLTTMEETLVVWVLFLLWWIVGQLLADDIRLFTASMAAAVESDNGPGSWFFPSIAASSWRLWLAPAWPVQILEWTCGHQVLENRSLWRRPPTHVLQSSNAGLRVLWRENTNAKEIWPLKTRWTNCCWNSDNYKACW